MQATLDYAQPYLTSKAVFANPSNLAVELSGSTGYNGFVLGGLTKASIKSSSIDSWRVAASYIGKDFVAAAHSETGFQSVTGTYWQQLDAASSVAAEVKHIVGSKQPELMMGYSHVAESGVFHHCSFTGRIWPEHEQARSSAAALRLMLRCFDKTRSKCRQRSAHLLERAVVCDRLDAWSLA